MNRHSIALSWTVMGACLILVVPASAQEETGAESVEAAEAQTGVNGGQAETTPDSASPTGQGVPPALSIEYPESTKKRKKKKPEPETQQQLPGPVSVEYVEAKKPEPEPAETGVYSKKVQGKLWLEVFVGPTSYDPDRFGAGNFFFDVDLEAPKVKGPEFGAAFGGAIADQLFFIGAVYRQTNYEIGEGLGGYKLMKVGLDLQLVMSFVSYVHPLIRFGLGYARLFGGNFSVVDLKTNGLYYTLGAGVRIPIVRWLSFVATFDWSKVTIYPKGGEGFNIDGSQLGGTFGLTLHFLGVKE